MSDAHAPAPAQHAAGDGAPVGVVYAGGYVNKLDARRLERECRLKLEAGCRALVINFRDTEIVNSIGVSILFDVIEAADNTGARVVFSNINGHNRQLFEMLGLTMHAIVAETEEDALRTFREFATSPAGH